MPQTSHPHSRSTQVSQLGSSLKYHIASKSVVYRQVNAVSKQCEREVSQAQHSFAPLTPCARIRRIPINPPLPSITPVLVDLGLRILVEAQTAASREYGRKGDKRPQYGAGQLEPAPIRQVPGKFWHTEP